MTELARVNHDTIETMRNGILAFDDCTDELLDSIKHLEAHIKHLETHPQRAACHDACVVALEAARTALADQRDAFTKEKEEAQARLDADPEYIQAEFNSRVLCELYNSLALLTDKYPIAYIPGSLRDGADLYDVITAVREKRTTGKAGVLAHTLDPPTKRRITMLKQRPCQIMLRYMSKIRRTDATDLPVEFRLDSARIITGDTSVGANDVLGYIRRLGKHVDPDPEHIAKYGGVTRRVERDARQFVEEFDVTVDGQAFWR
jgi:hypothetical protein